MTGIRVLDASALLALMQGEPGAEAVSQALSEARVSAVNLSEVVAKLQEYGLADEQVDDDLADLGLTIVEFDEAQAIGAGRLRRLTRGLGLSLGDRACLSLALSLDAPAVTTDRGWRALDLGVAIELAR